MAITLKAARVNAGMTQTEAAEQLGVTKNTLSNWEVGRSAPTAPQVKRLVALYRVTFEELTFSDPADGEEASET